ncbi:DNA-binding MarR family transcriptional regulator [Paraburkholderia sp. GAS199]|uniref:MarR family winged helix-turn-helix transcriptional regulator n=1 Tax=Paraburkholderia sp. GAS199 TaxID=3035126 RepID=UPI003D1A0410
MYTTSPEYDDCFAIRQAARHISQLYERHLSAAQITPTQFNILAILKRGARLTMVELAQAMVMDRTTLVRAVRPLIRDEFIVSQPDDEGSRRLHLFLTDSGYAKLQEAMTYWVAAQEEFERKFGHQQASDLRSELFRVTRDVSKD